MLFKQPEIRKFHYVSRYYDPRKEAKEERMKRIAKKTQDPSEQNEEERREAFRERLHRSFSENSTRYNRSPFSSSSLRFFAILIFLIIAVLFLYFKYFDKLIRMFNDF